MHGTLDVFIYIRPHMVPLESSSPNLQRLYHTSSSIHLSGHN